MSAKYSHSQRKQQVLVAAGSGSQSIYYLPVSETPTNAVHFYGRSAVTCSYQVQTSNMTVRDAGLFLGDAGGGDERVPATGSAFWYTDSALTGTLQSAADSTALVQQYGNIGARFARLVVTNIAAVAITGTLVAHGKE